MGAGTDLLSFIFRGPVQYDARRPLYIDAENPARSLNRVQVQSLIRTLIAGLRAHGVQQGDCVLVHLPGSVSLSLTAIDLRPLTGRQIIYPLLNLAIIGAGGVYMGSNPRSQPYELEHIIDLAEPRLVITSPDALRMTLDAAATRGMAPSQIHVLDEFATSQLMGLASSPWADLSQFFLPTGSHVETPRSVAELLLHGQNDWVSFDDEGTAKATPATMFSTSGTSGLPKAAINSHHALISQHLAFNADAPYEITRLISLPMFHISGALYYQIFPVRYGQPLYILPRFEPTQFMFKVYQFQATETLLVPPMVHAINQYPTIAKQLLLSSLRYVAVGAAPIGPGAVQQLRAMLAPQARAAQMWGMTEIGIVTQSRHGQDVDMASIGSANPGWEIRLLGADGSPVVGDERPGEMQVRGPGLLSGYKGRTDAVEPDGWFATGDVAYVKNGCYYLVGRSKELIKVRGCVLPPYSHRYSIP